MLSFYKKIIKNDYVFSVISRGIGVVLGVVYMVLFNRFFGASLKGESAIILNYVTIFSTILDCGITQSYAYYRKKVKNVNKIYFSNISLLFLISLLICIFISLFIKDKTILIILLILPLRIFSNQINSMISIETPRKRNFSSILLNFIDIFIIIFLFFIFKSNYKILSLFLIIKEFIYLLVSLINAKQLPTIKYVNLNYLILFARFGFFSMICILLMEINYRVDVIMLGSYVSTAEIGVYSLGVSLSERVWLVPDALRDILLSKLSKGKNEDEVRKICSISFWACLSIVILVIIFGKPLIFILFGKEFIDSYNITCVLLIGVLGMVFYKMIYAYFIIKGNQRSNVFILTITAIINIIGNLFMIPKYGIIGAAITSVISYTICGVLFILFFCRTTSINFYQLILIKKTDLVSLKHFFIVGEKGVKK